MIFKAIIKELPEPGNNKFVVRIPPLEDNTTNEFTLPALLCNQPGEYAGYEVGDVVFIEFENNKLDVPIILGKLYINVENKGKGFHRISRLDVTDAISIPDNTSLGGYTVKDFFSLFQRVENTISNVIYYELASNDSVSFDKGESSENG